MPVANHSSPRVASGRLEWTSRWGHRCDGRRWWWQYETAARTVVAAMVAAMRCAARRNGTRLFCVPRRVAAIAGDGRRLRSEESVTLAMSSTETRPLRARSRHWTSRGRAAVLVGSAGATGATATSGCCRLSGGGGGGTDDGDGCTGSGVDACDVGFVLIVVLRERKLHRGRSGRDAAPAGRSENRATPIADGANQHRRRGHPERGQSPN